MNKTTRKFPESQPTIFDDDAVAQEIMLELGVWDVVSKRGKPTSNLSMVVAETHPTHWCMCSRHWDNTDPNENGFQVITYPKRLVDGLMVHTIMMEFIAGGKDVTCRPFDYKSWE